MYNVSLSYLFFVQPALARKEKWHPWRIWNVGQPVKSVSQLPGGLALKFSRAIPGCFNYSQAGGQWRTWLQNEKWIHLGIAERANDWVNQPCLPIGWTQQTLSGNLEWSRSNQYGWNNLFTLVSTQIMCTCLCVCVCVRLSALNWIKELEWMEKRFCKGHISFCSLIFIPGFITKVRN